MRIILLSAAIALAMQPQPASAQAPDYVAFGEYAAEVARTITSIQSCKRMGFAVEDGSSVPSDISDRAVRRAVMMGIDRSTAESILLDALNRERTDIELLSTVPDDADTTQELVAYSRETFSFWDRRCRAMAASEVGSGYVKVTGDEERVQREALEDLTRKIEAAAEGD